jgi:beta-N-acetylhexosaminidase
MQISFTTICLFLFLSLPFYSHSQNQRDTSSQQAFTLADFYLYHPQLEQKVDEFFNKLDDSQRVGQMIIQAAGRLGKPTETITKLVREQKLGGVLMLGGNKEELKKLGNNLNTIVDQTKGIPLLYSADAEPSLINRKITGVQKVKNTSDIAGMEECREVARIISRELLDMGIKQNFAPVSDLTTTNKAITNRSFGNSRDTVIWMSDVFIQTTQQMGLIATAKHFPGHGYVKGDSHVQLIYIDGQMQEVDTYKPLIQNGVLSVMVGHIAVVNNEEYNTEGLPASCSRKIVTDLLKTQLGFKGLVVTDAMNMGALNKIPQSTLKAVQAGCDMILMPPNETALVNAVLKEMATNEAFKNQVYTSVKKVLRAKICLGMLP